MDTNQSICDVKPPSGYCNTFWYQFWRDLPSDSGPNGSTQKVHPKYTRFLGDFVWKLLSQFVTLKYYLLVVMPFDSSFEENFRTIEYQMEQLRRCRAKTKMSNLPNMLFWVIYFDTIQSICDSKVPPTYCSILRSQNFYLTIPYPMTLSLIYIYRILNFLLRSTNINDSAKKRRLLSRRCVDIV